jgi:hypothetical protein
MMSIYSAASDRSRRDKKIAARWERAAGKVV